MTSAIVVAAGRGTRFGPSQDKLFLAIEGVPVVGHTWQTFDRHPEIDSLVLVVRDSLEPDFRSLGRQLKVRKPFTLVTGGPERQDSVWNGLQALAPGTSVVAIQDGARPCTSHPLITACLRSARVHGAAVAAQPVTDTIKESSDGKAVARHLDRSTLFSVQTPQTFQVQVILRALNEVRRRRIKVTDDTAACELIGQRVHLVLSTTPNPKVTLPADLDYIRLLLRSSK